MLKLLLMVVVLAVVGWFWLGRRRPPGPPPVAPKAPKPAANTPPQSMLACAHCGVHLPQADALFDVGGKPFCSEAHRLQGPR